MSGEETDILEQLKGYLFYAEVLGIRELPKIAPAAKTPLPERKTTRGRSLLEKVRKEVGDCTRCQLHMTRRNMVFGDGNPDARLMFIGEAPGADEDAQGIPFVGRAGQLLNRVLEMVGLSRDDVYIANILKCRPPGNRTPAPEETEMCMPFLLKQIDAIEPKVICALGSVATNTLMGRKFSITKVRGTILTTPHGYTLMPTFHPAYLLRNPGEKRTLIRDLQMLKDMCKNG